MYGIFSYIYHKNQPNVGIYIPYMDPMGKGTKAAEKASSERFNVCGFCWVQACNGRETVNESNGAILQKTFCEASVPLWCLGAGFKFLQRLFHLGFHDPI